MWLQVSTKGEYGVRIMVDLARHHGERPRSLTDIAQAEMLPLAYLEQLAKLLREADPPLIVSTRGAHGGYRLSRHPEEITMGEILRVLEGPIAPMICATEGEMTDICGFLWVHLTRNKAPHLNSLLSRIFAWQTRPQIKHALHLA